MSGPVSENGRPSLDTEAVSPEASFGEIKVCFCWIVGIALSNGLQVDASMLDPSCLVPPTIPNTLGAEDIDKVRNRLYCERISSYIVFQGDCCSDQRADSGNP